MFRYIAHIWDPTRKDLGESAERLASQLQSRSTEWAPIVQMSGLHVSCAGIRKGASEAFNVPAAGVVLGTLFAGDASRPAPAVYPKATLTESDSHALVDSQGQHLVERFWGRYVAFINDPRTKRCWVLRSPTGGLPAFTIDYQGILIIFSQIEDCLDLGLGPFTINWPYIRNRVAAGSAESDETALKEIRELRNGERLAIAAGKVSRSFFWHPFDIVRSGSIEDPSQAAEKLRSVCMASVASWASCFDSVLHRLSGGLDSSIVLGCLSGAVSRPRVTCLNYYAEGWNSGDERRFARLAAERARCELVEQARSPQSVRFEQLCNLAPTVNPLRHLAHLETGALERELAHARGATAVFNGDPGDSLFCRHEMQLAVTDYARRYGLSRDLFALAVSVAPLVGLSIWTILGAAVRDGVVGSKSEPGKGLVTNRTLVHKALIDQEGRVPNYVHPWYRPSANIAPGKLLQIRTTLSYSEFFYPPALQAGDPEEVSPLHSQPLVELCLRIPTWLHMYGGHDRGLARRAFERDLPPEICTRYWKGSGGRLAKDVVTQNMPVARRLLLDGILLSERLLDRRAVEDALSDRPSRSTSHALEIFEMLLIEGWLQTWSNVGRRAAA